MEMAEPGMAVPGVTMTVLMRRMMVIGHARLRCVFASSVLR